MFFYVKKNLSNKRSILIMVLSHYYLPGKSFKTFLLNVTLILIS